MTRDEVRATMNRILERQGKAPLRDERQTLRELGFRSLDFSELALRVEQARGHELGFDAAKLRAIECAGDVLDFFANAGKP
jgi:acyl carrier protein